MQVTENFETVEELYRTGVACVYSARRAPNQPQGVDEEEGVRTDPRSLDTGKQFAIKIIQPALFMVERSALREMHQSFLERAAAQRAAALGASVAEGDGDEDDPDREPEDERANISALAAVGTDGPAFSDPSQAHWAQVHEMGESADGAYYVTDLYPRSAQKLVDRRQKIDHASLFHVVDSVFAGLQELQKATARAHANLKPSNVLIGPGKKISEARVVLTDPASMRDMLRKGGESSDLRAVGELIHQLVTFRPSDPGDWPIGRSPGWSKLGSTSKAWREFTSKLLAPDLGGLTVEEAHRQLKNMKARGTAVLKGALVGAAVVLLAAIAVGGWWYVGYQRDWRALGNENEKWVQKVHGPFTGELRNQAMNDPGLRPFVQAFDEADRASDPVPLDPQKIAGKSGGAAPISLAARTKTRAALTRVRDLRDRLAHWQTLTKWQTRQKDEEQKHHAAAAAYLGRVLGGTQPDSKGDLVGDKVLWTVRAVLYLESQAGQGDFTVLVAYSKDVDEYRAQFDKQAPMLGNYGVEVQKSIDRIVAGASSSPIDLLAAMKNSMSDFRDSGIKLAAILKNEWPKIDQDRFRADYQGKVFSMADLSALSKKLENYRKDPETGGKVVADIAQARQEATAQIARLKSLPDGSAKAKDLETQLQTLTSEIDSIPKKDKWIVLDTINGVGDPVRSKLRDLVGKVAVAISEVGGDPDQWLATAGDFNAANDTIKQAYATQFQKLLGGRKAADLKADPAGFVQLKERVGNLRDALSTVATSLPTGVPEGIDPAFAPVASNRLSQTIRDGLTAIQEAGGKFTVDEAKLRTLAEQFNSDVKQLKELASDTSATFGNLDEGYGLSEPNALPAAWVEKWSKSPALGDPTIAAAVKPLVDRLNALRATENWSADNASQALVNPATRAEIGVAALRRLLAGKPPVTADDFAREASTRTKLDDYLNRFVKDEQRRNSLRSLFQSGASRRWASFLNALNTTDDAQVERAITAAMAAQQAFGVADQSELQPWVKYNVILYQFRLKLRDPAAGPPEKLAGDFLKELERANLDKSMIESTRQAQARIRADATVSGPQVPSWQLTSSGDQSVRTYTYTTRDVTRTLKFRLVQVTNDSATYLCTTELPVEIFLDLCEADRDGQLRQVLPRNNDEMGPGPRGWFWNDKGRIDRPYYWLRTADRVTDYPLELKATNNAHGLKDEKDDPRTYHPVQQISPLAADKIAKLLGCRLPTPDEWRAAKQQSGGAQAQYQNLRDATWKQQYQYASSQRDDATRRELMPNAGIFLPGGRDDFSVVQNYNDGKLWFAPVDRGANSTNDFNHLVGNVAEFYYDFGKDEYGVIGGSAMSPATMDVTANFPIERSALKQGYSDVGIRLAFSAAGSEARFRAMLTNLSYQRPPAR